LIFVITGTNTRPFNRLLVAVDSLAQTGRFDFVVQTGYSTFIPKHCRHFDFCDGDKFIAYINDADIVITQAGFGSVGHCIRHNKPLILVPREYKYGEAVDKQYELAEHLARTNESMLCVRNMLFLERALEHLKYTRPLYQYHTIIPDLISTFIRDNFGE
jgi:UDP-N-acetylglucosamine transferase subunit ALG13